MGRLVGVISWGWWLDADRRLRLRTWRPACMPSHVARSLWVCVLVVGVCGRVRACRVRSSSSDLVGGCPCAGGGDRRLFSAVGLSRGPRAGGEGSGWAGYRAWPRGRVPLPALSGFSCCDVPRCMHCCFRCGLRVVPKSLWLRMLTRSVCSSLRAVVRRSRGWDPPTVPLPRLYFLCLLLFVGPPVRIGPTRPLLFQWPLLLSIAAAEIWLLIISSASRKRE